MFLYVLYMLYFVLRLLSDRLNLQHIRVTPFDGTRRRTGTKEISPIVIGLKTQMFRKQIFILNDVKVQRDSF